ncbi:phosphoribosylaminoimidazolesuccinocarboxamide synthase [Cohnella thailandensis]|uniref:Phosphoribosylaminoimidazole-succinocarboxamide synthase n=1 Tax=Cohnella thailandensis TaxID=557557 RepID=A0A841T1R3_9BACL|nr:phosphoribosylaminoimidazolesuccinocarboxamide synthase [Cohnella thailandensis]MBB6636020.1 phosphoribosylaminoimidazolesuccinocarboxamide synthase [Cohnella thailandensis]MBP1976826.1 phosphoribosylaminoimidazole-succinocarboxamide synthase [Cohnella thailandensis]
MSTETLSTAEGMTKAPLIHKGKVRELYDLGDRLLIVVTDRISAFDYVLDPPVPDKGKVLNGLSSFWFEQTGELLPNHVIHTDVNKLGDLVADSDKPKLEGRIMVSKKAKRIDIECVVRGYITGGGWKQYQKSGEVNGIKLPEGLRKNSKLEQPIFTPAGKNDVGHDEDIPFEEMARRVGRELAEKLQELSLKLYSFGRDFCAKKGIILADCKFEFGLIDNEIILIDELFTPDSSRFWADENYKLDVEIDSMDKQPVRAYLENSDWDKISPPPRLPDEVVAATSARYRDIYRRLTNS